MSSGQSIERRPRWVRIGLAGLALAAAVGIAACGGDSGIESSGNDEVEVTTATAEGEPGGKLTISNWPFYIDRKTVSEFEEETGIQVKYIEDVNDNEEFFGKMQPLLGNGEAGGRDIFVVSDFIVPRMYDLGYLQNFDKSALGPAYENLKPSLAHPDFDPDRSFTLPWQSGITGLVVNTKEAPDVKSIADLFDPKYKGKVEMLTELTDTIPLILQMQGIDVGEATEEQWLDAIAMVEEAASSGQIRRFTGNDYVRDMANGDAVAVIGWSGDAVQLQADNPDIEFVLPTDGCNLWSDEMVIPVGAPNPTAAYAWMNYVYDPTNQAQITAYNNYVEPVEGVRELFEAEDSPLAESELIFPSDEFIADCTTDGNPPAESEQTIQRAWQAVLNG